MFAVKSHDHDWHWPFIAVLGDDGPSRKHLVSMETWTLLWVDTFPLVQNHSLGTEAAIETGGFLTTRHIGPGATLQLTATAFLVDKIIGASRGSCSKKKNFTFNSFPVYHYYSWALYELKITSYWSLISWFVTTNSSKGLMFYQHYNKRIKGGKFATWNIQLIIKSFQKLIYSTILFYIIKRNILC